MTNLPNDVTSPSHSDVSSLGRHASSSDATVEQHATSPTLSEKMAALANNYNAPQVVAQLPQLSIDVKNHGANAAAQGEENTTGAFVKGAAQTFLHSLVQSPLEGVAQVIDHTVGSPFQTHLYDKSKNLIFSAPEQTTFGTAEWHGQAIGGALAMIPLFLASRGALRSTAGAFKLTEGLVASEAEAAASSKIFSSTGAKMILEGGATGAAYSGVFKPVESSVNGSDTNNYWRAKATTMADDFATFATLTASSIYLNTALKSVVEPVIAKAPALAPFASRVVAVAAGSLSGAPAAVLETSLQSLQSANQNDSATNKDSFTKQLGQNIYSYAFVGGALGALHSQPAATKIENARLEITKPVSAEAEAQPTFVPLQLTKALKYMVEANTFTDDRYDTTPIAELGDMKSYLLSPPDFQNAIGQGVVGELPVVFDRTGLTEIANFHQLDSLARALRNLDSTDAARTEDHGLRFSIGVGKKQLAVSRIGQDASGNVYNLRLSGQDFDFKVAHTPTRLDLQSTYTETATHIFLQQQKATDLPEFFASHPDFSAGWLLRGKAVNSGADKETAGQPGRTTAQILTGSGLKITAPSDSIDTTSGTADLSRLEPEFIRKPLTTQSLQILLSVPQKGFDIVKHLDGIPTADLKDALLICLERTTSEPLVPRAAARLLTEPADLADVLRRALSAPRGSAQAAAVLDKLAGSEHFKPLYDLAMATERSRIEAVKHLDKLPDADRKAAFDQAFEYPQLRVAAARKVDSIQDPTQRAAAEAAIKSDPGAYYARLQQIAETRPLSEAELATQQQSFEQHLDRFGLKTGAKINEITPTKSFRQWLATNDVTSGQAAKVAGIWTGLNDSQRQLAAQPLSILADSNYHLKQSQWRTLNAEETFNHLNLISNHSFISGIADAFNKPSFAKWVSKNGSDAAGHLTIDAYKLLNHWDQIPQSVKDQDVRTVASVLDVFTAVKPQQWQAVAPADLFDVAQAIKMLNPNHTDATTLVNNADFVHWYKDNNLAAKTDQREVKAILASWDKFSPEQKKLDFESMAKLGNFYAESKRLEKVFGADSPISKYIIALHSGQPDQSLPAVADWFAGLIGYQTETAVAKKVLTRLVEEGAPVERFEPIRLNNDAMLERYYGEKPAMMATLTETFPDPHRLAAVLNFVSADDRRNVPLVDAVIKEGFTGSPADWDGLTILAKIYPKMALSPEDGAYLFRLHNQGMRLGDLLTYVSENPGSISFIEQLILDHAGPDAIDGRRLEDHDNVYRFYDFNAEQLEQLEALCQAGLSTTRLLNHITDRPLEKDAVKQLLAEGASPEQFRDYMRLAAFPPRTDLKLVEAISAGQITTEEVLVKVRDWQSGRHFRDLLINHVQKGGKLSKNDLEDLQRRAVTRTEQTTPGRTLQQDESLIAAHPEAATFVDAAKNILQKIPTETPIVLLGRDAWPLVPILRANGRDAQYFLWSRLQIGDSSTEAQWLKEIAPHAAVIDTGFAGSIIGAIRVVDPTVTGYLMSSAMPTIYPTLLSSPDHRIEVNRIENMPKLIYRSSKHTTEGGAVSRRNLNSSDTDVGKTMKETSRWYIERSARELLRASGLPDWDVWRYSQFVGLTPQERLGMSTKADVEAHYQSVENARRLSAEAQGQ